MIVCTCEDRTSSLVALQVLVLSLARHCPDVDVHACVPAASDEFLQWADRHPTLHVIPRRAEWPTGWNIKPTLLANRLAAGHDEVVWLDTDIAVTRDFRPSWPTDDTLVVAEEWDQGPEAGSRPRTQAFGLAVGREFPRAINSSVVRVTAAHQRLLTRWAECMARPEYLRDQTRPTRARALHHVCDQDALAALLGSRDFAEVPVRLLRAPGDILHTSQNAYRSYPVVHRLAHLLGGLPPLVHALGLPKPWSSAVRTRKSVGLSPYCAVAAAYADDLSGPSDWLWPQTAWGRASHNAALGSPCLRDLATVLAAEVRPAVKD